MFGLKLRKIVTRNKILLNVTGLVSLIIFKIISLPITAIFPVQNKAVFSSFKGSLYDGNPKYLSEKLHEIQPRTQIIWLLNNHKNIELPKYIKVVRYSSVRSFYHNLTSKILVDDVVKPMYFIKRKGQFYLQTWHGDRGFKKIIHDDKSRFYVTRENKICDAMISGSRYADEVIRSAFKYKGKILDFGLPRNDLLVLDQCNAFGLEKNDIFCDNSRLLIYAPTYRDVHKLKNPFLEEKFINNLLDILQIVTSNKWNIIIKLHQSDRSFVTEYNSERVKIITNEYPTDKLLKLSDFLITDYSSIAGDYILLQKPICLFIYDYSEYQNIERSLYFDIKKSPYVYAETPDELLKVLDDNFFSKSSSNIKKIHDFYGVKETGLSSEKIVNYINSKLEDYYD